MAATASGSREAKKIEGYPTWEIQGQPDSGVKPLAKLAEASGPGPGPEVAKNREGLGADAEALRWRLWRLQKGWRAGTRGSDRRGSRLGTELTPSTGRPMSPAVAGRGLCPATGPDSRLARLPCLCPATAWTGARRVPPTDGRTDPQIGMTISLDAGDLPAELAQLLGVPLDCLQAAARLAAAQRSDRWFTPGSAGGAKLDLPQLTRRRGTHQGIAGRRFP